MIASLFFAGYVATIPAANWLIGHVGTVCEPHGPCLIPVWPGIMAPSGIALAALALVLRDLVQRFAGLIPSVFAILCGALLSALFAPPALVLASTGAFVISETLDAFVYTPLQRKGLILAVVCSGLVGLLADSICFLWFAFGSFDHLLGQIIGKTWTILAAALVISLTRKWLPTPHRVSMPYSTSVSTRLRATRF